ncbi:FAD-dependent oxidoreductase [Ktedonospora formicarum]|uniref:Monooxygenase n=1 Tax=Ktedonospora formicarum TaxID=2778364 RepID=A0A8J3MXQ5_9CHLR|nr:FAD-dependent oxidoreductase [Ktedonospora formicarum]GHO50246.1 monooxygenase [Ktedonospora formicarum]
MDSVLQYQEHSHEQEAESKVRQTTCCIVGAGPAGAFLALLLARQGIAVTLLEAHKDFEREFRGDTIHPAILEEMDKLGLAENLLRLPHTRAYSVQFHTEGTQLTFDDFRRLKSPYPYIMKLSQVQFLNFLVAEARQYPHFQLIMGARVEHLIEEEGVIRGVRYRSEHGEVEVHAELTIGADGRFSWTRRLAEMAPEKLSPPLDFLWFHLPRKEQDPREEAVELHFAPGMFIILLDRGEKWQVGCAISKGTYQQVRQAGIEELQSSIAACVPWLADRVTHLQSWKQASLLSIESSRLKRWHKPGLLLIGDAAHVMSPIGSVGINLAIQDAIAAANLLTMPLKGQCLTENDLARVQRRRELRTLISQTWVGLIQRQIVSALDARRQFRLPPVARFLLRVPLISSIPTRITALGGWQERIRL